MFGESSLNRWRSATRFGQAALEANDVVTAARLFHEAVEEAGRLLCQRCEDLPTPRMYVQSCHYLAQSYRRLGHLELARQLLREAHQRLLDSVREPCLPPTVRRECLEELSQSLIPLMFSLQGMAGAEAGAHPLPAELPRLQVAPRAGQSCLH